MENNVPAPEQLDNSEELLAKARANRKSIVWCMIALFVIIIAVLIYIFVAQAGSAKADELVAKADSEQVDSVALQLYKQAADAGYKSGHRAAAEAGIRLYQEGNYEEALKYLDKASLDDKVAAAGVYTLQGDCHVNLDQLDAALKCYDKAISKADKNPEIVPFVLIKEANIYRAQQNFKAEAKCYDTIIKDYPEYVRSSRVDIKKYYERANAQAQN
ncbi:MAG: tetratricopeptide repeat protein [Bacteroidales bacterium]|nr:tetratricopeptide repeat protein [Bacteroidales bacterium]